MFKLADHIPKDKLEAFCRKHHIKKLAVFGSALRGELRPGSDIDLLVEFAEGKTPGLLSFCGLENQLTQLAGRKVDLRTAGDLSRYFRNEVINQAMIQYASG